MKKTVVMMLAVVAFAGTAFAEEYIELPASRHNVMFPHRKHQKLIKDCKKCHEENPGVVEDLGKEWAHKTCRGCHESAEKGPRICTGCHRK